MQKNIFDFFAFFAKKFKKGIDKQKVLWYNIQVLAAE
jgi:hypothetical protein